MNTMIFIYVTASAALQSARERLTSEEGQTSVEWLGIAAVIVAIVVILTGNASTQMGNEVRDAFQGLVDAVSTGKT